VVGKKLTGSGYCVCFESFSFLNLGYMPEKELGPGEIDFITPEGYEVLVPPRKDMRICTFLWIYYGFPASSYEGVNVEDMRYGCGTKLAERDLKRGNIHPDCVAGVPDSGVPHAIGYANESGKRFARPFVKYTPTWPRSFMPSNQAMRDQVAKMKQIPVPELIEGRKLLFVDDSIVRGTQLQSTVDFLYESGAAEVHMRSACPPIMYACKYLNFSRNNSDMDLLARRVIRELEGSDSEEHLAEYADASTERGRCLLHAICEKLGFDSLGYQSLDGLLEAIGIDRDKICTYCWNGKE
jgi:amidophosphoribosyltransferase